MVARKSKNRQAVRNKKGGFPGWGYAVIAFIVGALLMVVVLRGNLLSSMKPGVAPTANPRAVAQQDGDQGVASASSSARAPKKPQYDFYSVLSEKEVRIPDAEISAQARAEQQQKELAARQAAAPAVASIPAATPNAATRTDINRAISKDITAAPASAVPVPAAGSGYLLQVGAFPSPADAETLKAKLALQGFVAQVQSANIEGQTYHRVRLGPFRSATELESVKQRLASAGFNAIALKEGK
ncbi:MAG: SPOR domain-containing protein [Rhodanobacter sp.]